MSRRLNFHQNLKIITGILHEDQYTFLTISRSVLLRMRNISEKSCTENQNTRFMFVDFFFENRALYEIMWKDTVRRTCHR